MVSGIMCIFALSFSRTFYNNNLKYRNMALYITNHPLIQHKLTIMRKRETGTLEFRELLKEIGMLMGYEVCRDFPLKEVEIETPMQKMTAHELDGQKVAVVPGNAFGDCGEGFLRISYAYSIENLKKGRIKVFSGNYTGVNPINPADTIDLNTGYTECQYSSNPSFGYVLRDCITVEN